MALTALLTSSWAHAEPLGNILTDWNQTGFGFIADGTSNTIAFTETTQLSVCLRGVSLEGAPGFNTITDGSSNTIMFGETNPFRVNVGRVFAPHPISEIADGTSNTILFEEIPLDNFCLGEVTPVDPGIVDGTSNTILFGEESEFDVCVDAARIGIADGSSNTILFGEIVPRTCLESVRVAEAGGETPRVPEPATLSAFGLAIVAALARRAKPPRA